MLWLTDLQTAMWSLVLVDVWQWTPFIMLISLAGLSAVPKYLYEAADVDRASGWFKFRHITLPLVTPLLLIAVLFRMMDSYKMFDQAYALTGGGPGAPPRCCRSTCTRWRSAISTPAKARRSAISC